MRLDPDTIVAISTPPGRGGIGIVRLSGPQALAIVAAFLRLRTALSPARARFTHVVDDRGEVLDEAVVTWFAAPHSYTTEDVVEIAAHGAPVLLNYLLQACLKAGARLAGPGEFTQRAFLAGRLDLTQAEAVNDLISAHTLHQAKIAAAQLGGAIAYAVRPVKESLLRLIAALEAGVDFAEDDLDLLSDEEIVEQISALEAPLRALAKTYAYGRVVRDGVTLAIVGAPNAGKSSLFNRLLERERAIVTALPGTTRDTITEALALDGIPIDLVDTAGLREIHAAPETEAERAGIERTRQTLADADLVLHVIDRSTLETALDGSVKLRLEDEELQAALRGRVSILVLNKSDLDLRATGGIPRSVVTCALTGEGLDELRQAIREAVAAESPAEPAMITHQRQSLAVEAAVASLAKARASAEARFPHEFLLLDLHEGLAHLDELTGATAADAVLQLIFSSFCIGK